MPKSQKLDKTASALLSAITELVMDGGDIHIHQPVANYRIVRLSANDGTDYEEIIVDTRGREAGNVSVSRRTVPRAAEKGKD